MYGRALAAAGHLREGVERLTLAVEDAAEVFGPSSRMVGFFSVPLVKYQVQSGRIEQALETSRTALEIIGQHSALDSFRYASALHARGVALVAADRAAEALPLLTRAAETLRRQGPAPHDAMREWMADQSLALAKLGQYEETENVVREIPLAARIP